MPRNIGYYIAGLAILALLLFNTFFVVDETQQVVITQLGKPVGSPIVKAGLYMKIPFIQKANFFDKRILKWDGRPNQIPTKDKKYIWVDTTARWKIKDPLLFMMRAGSVSTALSRLDGIIDAVVRDHVSDNNLVELVRSEGWEEARRRLEAEGLQGYVSDEAGEISGFTRAESTPLVKGREKITREMVADASKLIKELGIELLDIRIKRINYVASVQRKVFDRMISERKRIAAQYRSEGEGEKAAILGAMNKELAKITSEAFWKAQEIRGKADAEATRIYAEAYRQDPEFYQFYKTLEFYKRFPNKKSVFVLSSDAEIFRYLKHIQHQGSKEGGE